MVRFLLVVALALFPFVSCGNVGCASVPTAEAPRFASYRDIPGVTDAEIEAIAALRASRDTLVYGMVFGTESFFGKDSGDIRGFTALFCDYLSTLFGMNFKPQIFEWDDMLAKFSDGDIDFLGDLTITPELLTDHYMTDPIAIRVLNWFRAEDSTPLEIVAETRRPRYAFLEDTPTLVEGAALSGVGRGGDFDTLYVPDYATAHKYLKSGEADAFFDEHTVEAIFEDFGGIASGNVLPLTLSPISLSARKPELEPVISVIQKMLHSDGRRYLTDMYARGEREFARHRFELALTEEEREYIRSVPAVRVAAESDNYPICFYNKYEKRFEGVFIDVLREIERLSGINFEIVNTPDATWTEVLKMLEDGEVAMLSELMVMESRVGNFLWSNIPMATDYYALLSLSSSPYVEMNNIMDMRVGLQTGTANEALFLQWFPNHANTRQYIGMTAAAEALERGEVDLVMASQQQLLLMTNYLERPGFKVNILFDRTYDSRIGFNRGEAQLQSIIDKALAQIDLRRLSARWMSRTYDYRAKIAQSRLPYLIGALAMFLCVIILLTAMYVKERGEEMRLTALVRERTKEVEEQKKMFEVMSLTDHLTGIANRHHFSENMDREWRMAIRRGTSLSALIIDLDKFKSFNDTYGHQQGDEVLKQAVKIITQSLKRPCFRGALGWRGVRSLTA